MPEADVPAKISGLLGADDVFPHLIVWRQSGLKCALVTLIGIDGAAPRPIGAHMAVAEDGRFVGYLSGGCLEHAVAAEAQRVISDGQNRLVRYGRESPYFDLKLPCGSGLDLYFDQALDMEVLTEAARLHEARLAFSLITGLGTGESSISPICDDPLPPSQRRGDHFHRSVIPAARILLVGGGPALAAIATLASAMGFELDIASPDDRTRGELAALGFASRPMISATDALSGHLDRFTAAVVAYHEHDWEPPVLAELLRTPCFYIGVLGSKTVHANRLLQLAAAGLGVDDRARLRAPVGLIPGAKSRATLAVGVVAELTIEAKSRGILM